MVISSSGLTEVTTDTTDITDRN